MSDADEILSIDIKFPTIIYGCLNNKLGIFNIILNTTDWISFDDSVLFTKFIKNYFVACSYDGAIRFYEFINHEVKDHEVKENGFYKKTNSNNNNNNFNNFNCNNSNCQINITCNENGIINNFTSSKNNDPIHETVFSQNNHFIFTLDSEHSAFGDINAHFINDEYLAIGTENGYLTLFHIKADNSAGHIHSQNIILYYNFFLKDTINDITIENRSVYVSTPKFVTVFDTTLHRLYSFKLDIDMFIHNNVLIGSLDDTVVYYKSRVLREYSVQGKVMCMANVGERFFVGTDTDVCYVGVNYDLHAIKLKKREDREDSKVRVETWGIKDDGIKNDYEIDDGIKNDYEIDDGIKNDGIKYDDIKNHYEIDMDISENFYNHEISNKPINSRSIETDNVILGVNKVISLGNNLIAIGTLCGHVGVGDIRTDNFVYTKVKGVVHDLAYDNGIIAVGSDKGVDIIFLD